MKKTRREFGLLSSLGIGGTLASSGLAGRRFEAPPETGQPRTFRLHEDPSYSCFEVNLAFAGGSEVIAAYARSEPGRETGDILLTRSRDGGAAWHPSTREALFSSDASSNSAHQLAAIACLHDGVLLASTTRFRSPFEGKLRWRRGVETDGVYLRESVDGGHRWGEIRRVDAAPFEIAWTRGAIVEMPDGSLLLPLAGQLHKTYRAAREPMVTFLLRSADRGVHWRYHGTIAHDHHGGRDYDEPVMIRLSDGRLLCMLRSHENPRRDPPGGYLYMTSSVDGGASWTKPQKTSMWGHPAHLLRLQDGRVLCTYGYRMHPAPGVRASLSKDGVEWKPESSFAIRTLPDLDSEHLQIGCPTSVQLNDGAILTAYHVWEAGRQCLEASLYRI